VHIPTVVAYCLSNLFLNKKVKLCTLCRIISFLLVSFPLTKLGDVNPSVAGGVSAPILHSWVRDAAFQEVCKPPRGLRRLKSLITKVAAVSFVPQFK